VRRLLDELSEVRQDAGAAEPRLLRGGGLVVVTGGGAAVGPVLARRAEFAAVVLVALGGLIDAPAGVRVLRAFGAAEAVRQWNDTIG
jgi:hypothetical protein